MPNAFLSFLFITPKNAISNVYFPKLAQKEFLQKNEKCSSCSRMSSNGINDKRHKQREPESQNIEILKYRLNFPPNCTCFLLIGRSADAVESNNKAENSRTKFFYCFLVDFGLLNPWCQSIIQDVRAASAAAEQH